MRIIWLLSRYGMSEMRKGIEDNDGLMQGMVMGDS